jgi:hypothetical protein
MEIWLSSEWIAGLLDFSISDTNDRLFHTERTATQKRLFHSYKEHGSISSKERCQDIMISLRL